MPIRVVVTRDFDHMSKVAGDLVKKDIGQTLRKKEGICPGPGHGEFTYRTLP